MRRILPFLLLISAAACDYGFEKQSHVSKLRVLAVRADPPEVTLGPGGEVPLVQLTALAVEPSGAQVQLRWALCTVVGLPEADLDCPGADGIELASNGPVSATLDLTGPLASMPPGSHGTPSPDVIPLSVGFEATAAGQSLHGFASINVRTSADAPAAVNPTVTALEIDGAPAAADGTTAIHSGAIVHLVPKSNGAPTFSFYSTEGDIDALRATAAAPEVDFTAPLTPGPVQIWIVARDGRGGVGWLARTVQVVP